VRRSSDHDRVNCRLGTRTVDAFQLLQRLLLLLSRLLVSYRPLANVEERRRRSRRNHTLGEKIMIEQVASSARQTLAAAKATSLQRCVRTQLRAGRHCLNPRARSPRRRPPLIPRRPSDARPARIVCPRRRPLAPWLKRLWRAAAAQDLEGDSAHVRQGTEMTQGGSGARRSRRARRIVTRAATYITLLRTQRENIPLRDCVRSMAWKPCVQKDAVLFSTTASYDSLTRCPRPIHVARVYLVSSYARMHTRTHAHTRRLRS